MTEAFGPGNVSYDKQDDGAEGETYMATVLFKKKPAERLVITWKDEKRQTKPGDITAKADAPTPGSKWALPNGIHPGSSLAEVEAANGKPFAISGFDWDYGGFATDWKGGSLAKALGPCAVSIRFNPGKGANTDKVSGETAFASNDPKMRAAKPYVSVISLSRK